MKLLVLCEDYPSPEKPYAMSYVHTRVEMYAKLGMTVDVTSFRAQNNYEYGGISVNSPENARIDEYDIIISHAPNLRNHIKFLAHVKNAVVAFTFHGHEVIKKYREYPLPYKWNKSNFNIASSVYDEMKIPALRLALNRIGNRNSVGFVFVSGWMKDVFARNMGRALVESIPFAVIPNSVNHRFLQSVYREPDNVAGDFITIRPLDERKYGVDLVMDAARRNPNKSFHVYGKGSFFEHESRPNNVTWFNEFIHQKEIPQLLAQYRCALMPTRYDAQGVMMCEMASFGMPLITSDIPICREMLGDFHNVSFIANENFGSEELNPPPRAGNNSRFDPKKLAIAEISFFKTLL